MEVLQRPPPPGSPLGAAQPARPGAGAGGAAFFAITLIPVLKYPPTPPAVGQHETVALRTAAFFLMIALSVMAAVTALNIGRRLRIRIGALNAGFAAVGA